MSVFRSADLDADIRNYEKAQQAWEDNLPRCDKCKATIDDYVWEIDGYVLCEDCAADRCRKKLEDYVR